MLIKNRLISMIYLTLFLIGFSPDSKAQEMPLEKQMDFLLKVLEFNKTIINSSGTAIRVAIIYDSNNEESKAAMPVVDDLFFNLVSKKVKVGGKSILYSVIAFNSTNDLLEKHKMFNFSTFFVLPGNQNNVAAIAKAAEATGVFTYSSVSSYVSKGLAVGVKEINGKPKILIHMPTAKAQKADFNVAILKIASIID